MPRYRENSLIVKCSMLCPGISQNTKHHHLTLYKGQVWGKKSYHELCDNNILSIAFYPIQPEYMKKSEYEAPAHREYKYTDIDNIMENGELYVPPVPRPQRRANENSKFPWDGEILQSFAELTHIGHITLHPDPSRVGDLKDIVYQIRTGGLKCFVSHSEQCIHHSYVAIYIWTKEGFKIN